MYHRTELVVFSENTTLSKLFESAVLLNISDENKEDYLILLDVSVSTLEWGTWKKVHLGDDISLSISFRRHYIRFKIANNVDEPPAKGTYPERRSASEALIAKAEKQDCLSALQQTTMSKDGHFSDVLGHLMHRWWNVFNFVGAEDIHTNQCIYITSVNNQYRL